MKIKPKPKLAKILSLNAVVIIYSLFTGFNALCQSLPNKQEISVWAPANIKIDGKATEWNDRYQAHNNATGVSYTICNNDKNLYIIVYISDPSVIFYKALTGGITFIIKQQDSEASIRYPAFFNNNIPAFARLGRGQVLSGKDDDSIIVKDNAVFADKAKEIGVKGIKDVDTLISVFNEHGIKAAGHFDAKQGYLYELCIPLKYLGLSAKKVAQKLKYQLILNGGSNKFVIPASSMSFVTGGTRADGTPIPQSEIDDVNARTSAGIYARYAQTDFSGEYTLKVLAGSF